MKTLGDTDGKPKGNRGAARMVSKKKMVGCEEVVNFVMDIFQTEELELQGDTWFSKSLLASSIFQFFTVAYFY